MAFAAGIAMGAAFSVKWSGAMAHLRRADPVVRVGDDPATSRRRRRVGRAFARAVRQESFGSVVAFLVLPVAVYILVYLPWFNHFGWSLKAWWENQTACSRTTRSLKTTALDTATHTYTPTHPYYSRAVDVVVHVAAGELLLARRRRISRRCSRSGTPRSSGRSVWAIPFVAVMWRRRRDWRAGFIVTAFLAQYLPWFVVTRPQFFFYVAPITPFMVLGDRLRASAISRAPRSSCANPTAGTVESARHPYLPFVVGVRASWRSGCSSWFWPVLTGNPISRTAWQARVWFRGLGLM